MSPPGGCTFDDGPAQCDYQQDLYDDFDWTHVSAQEVPYLPSDLPQGESVTHAGSRFRYRPYVSSLKERSEIRESKRTVYLSLGLFKQYGRFRNVLMGCEHLNKFAVQSYHVRLKAITGELRKWRENRQVTEH